MKLRNIFICSLLFLSLLVPATISAESCSKPPCPTGSTGKIKIENPLKDGTNTIQAFIAVIIKEVILPVGGVIAVIYIIYAGFMLVTARGNEAKLTEAKRAFFYAAIGTLILLGAWAIAEVIKGTIDQITR